MFSGGWGIGLVFATDHLDGINSVFRSVKLQRIELKRISRAVILEAAVHWDPCRSVKILVLGLFSDPLIQNLLGWSLSISVFIMSSRCVSWSCLRKQAQDTALQRLGGRCGVVWCGVAALKCTCSRNDSKFMCR